MKIFNIGLIRVLITNDRELLNFHGNILHNNFPFEVEITVFLINILACIQKKPILKLFLKF